MNKKVHQTIHLSKIENEKLHWPSKTGVENNKCRHNDKLHIFLVYFFATVD